MKGYVHSEWQSFHAYFFPSFLILTITVVLYNCTQHREEQVFQRILSSFLQGRQESQQTRRNYETPIPSSSTCSTSAAIGTEAYSLQKLSISMCCVYASRDAPSRTGCIRVVVVSIM